MDRRILLLIGVVMACVGCGKIASSEHDSEIVSGQIDPAICEDLEGVEQGLCFMESSESGRGLKIFDDLARSGDREAQRFIAIPYLSSTDPDLAAMAHQYALKFAAEGDEGLVKALVFDAVNRKSNERLRQVRCAMRKDVTQPSLIAAAQEMKDSGISYAFVGHVIEYMLLGDYQNMKSFPKAAGYRPETSLGDYKWVDFEEVFRSRC